MAKIHWKGSTLLGPVPPVMVTCGDMENANIITVAWASIINTHPPRVSISVRPTRYSYGIIKERGEFVINLTPTSLVRECDWCGIYTGAKVDKFAKTGLHKEPAVQVACPVIAECPLALECKVLDIIPQGTHDLFLAEVVGIDVEESLLDEEGKLCLDRAGLTAFAHGEYFALGEVIGKFGFSVAKESKGVPGKMPGKMPGKVPEKVPGKAPTKGKAPADKPVPSKNSDGIAPTSKTAPKTTAKTAPRAPLKSTKKPSKKA